ncbi:MAG: ATP-binding protein [Bacteroidaceae bacterium]|nr:ATP-binding protein [Bacteroidaceae bacterium]
MFLRSLSYIRNTGTPSEWRIQGSPIADEPLHFGSINLVIGQNATGKSNTLSALRDLADLVSGVRKIENLLYKTFDYDVVFENDGTPIRYRLVVEKGQVTDERLSVNGVERFNRKEKLMFYEQQGENLAFETSPEELGVTRIDSKQQSYMVPLYLWGRNLSHYEFGGSLGKNMIVRDLAVAVNESIKPRDTEKVSAFFAKALQLFANIKDVVINDMAEVGYKLIDIKSSPLKNIPINGYGIAVKEDGLEDYTDQQEMSQGMFRALSIIIQIEYSLLANMPSCILIDDIGEGLDYERSQKLINLIMKKASNNGLQVIMTSNDRFVMNNIPLQYWHVINRSGNRSVFYNMQNSKQVFDEFSYTGLNNFDFFADKFYIKGMEAFE